MSERIKEKTQRSSQHGAQTYVLGILALPCGCVSAGIDCVHTKKGGPGNCGCQRCWGVEQQHCKFFTWRPMDSEPWATLTIVILPSSSASLHTVVALGTSSCQSRRLWPRLCRLGSHHLAGFYSAVFFVTHPDTANRGHNDEHGGLLSCLGVAGRLVNAILRLGCLVLVLARVPAGKVSLPSSSPALRAASSAAWASRRLSSCNFAG